MNFSFNSYNKVNMPHVFLAYPNRKIICELNAKKRKSSLCAVGVSSFTFTVYQYSNKIKNKGFDEISIGKYIYVDNTGWFRITSIKKDDDGFNPSLEITSYDLSIELGQTYLTSFGSMGTATDSQGGLDRYALYDESDHNHSIVHIFMNKNPGWIFKYIDPEITKERRSFNNDSIASYEFLTGDVSETFECIFTFNGNDRSICAYKTGNFGKGTSIVLSYNNLVKSISIKWNEDDIKTVLHVTGGNDETGTALSIAAVNPGGNGYISNFSYFYKDMSENLQDKLKSYYKTMDNNKMLITTALSQLKILFDELSDLNHKLPQDESSTDWTQYGLVGLKAKSDQYKENMSVFTDSKDDPVAEQMYSDYNALWNAVNNEIKVRERQIEIKESQISDKQKEANSYVVDIQQVLGKDLYIELQSYIREDTFCDSSYITTDIMSDSEILEMKQSLYDHGMEQLSHVCYPQFDMSVESVNFPVIFKYKQWTQQLNLGDIITIKYSDDISIKARLLKMELNWDDFTDFTLTFSSKTSIDDGFFEFEEMKSLVDKTSTSLDFKTSGWNGAAHQATDAYYTSRKEFLDLSLQQIISNGKNQEVQIDTSGILLQKKLDNEKYAPEKLWLTNRQILLFEEPDGTNLKDPKVAIGKVFLTVDGQVKTYYGVAADVIYGRLLWGESLIIQNKNNSITMDDQGFIAKSTNGFRVQINPDDPNNIFNISKDDQKLLFIDAVKSKLIFKGRAEIDEGLIGGWTITTNKLYSGNVGMSSDISSGSISFWAGNSTPTLSPFRVTNQGKVYASNIDITGGTLNINSNFIVDTSGSVTCKNLTATGGAISGVSLNINNNFVVDKNGTMTARRGNFEGKISGATEIEVGVLWADEEYCGLGDFFVYSGDRRNQFSSGNEKVGMMSNAAGAQQAWLWAGSASEPYPFCVTGEGKVSIQEIANTTHWKGYSLNRALDYIWTNGDDCGLLDLAQRINRVENKIDNME